MIPKRTKSTLLAGLLLTGLTSGCFGNCGGCVGNKLGESFEAIGEAVEKDLQADIEEGLRDEADRELAVAEGREPARKEATGLSSYLPKANLSKLTVKVLKKRMGQKKYSLVECNDMEYPSEKQSQVECLFERKDRRVKVSLYGFERAAEQDTATSEILMERLVVVSDEGRMLALSVADVAGSRALMAKLAAPEVPSARTVRAKLEELGYHVQGCERQEEEEGTELSCMFSKGSTAGMAMMLKGSEDDPGLAGDLESDQPEWIDDLFLGQAKGKVVTSLMLTDRPAARALAKELLPGLEPGPDRLIITVTLDEEKPNGKGWDALGGAPDPYIKVNGESYRDERCEDAYECTFVVPRAASLEIKVIDADGAKDDSAGKTVCRPGEICETRAAALQVMEIW